MNTRSVGSRGESVSVVIPVLNAAPYLPKLIPALLAQKPEPPGEIILVDSGSKDGTIETAHIDSRIRVISINTFTHGGARNLGIRESRGDFILLMTQDALPADERWLESLLVPMGDPRVAGAYSRQVARPDASPMEKFFLNFRFPEKAIHIREIEPGTVPTYTEALFSNVSALIRRTAWQAHPFDETLLMCEDLQFARDTLVSGWRIAYAPESVVIHSHHYTTAAYFRRYFDSIYALRQVFEKHSLGTSSALGGSYLWNEWLFLARSYPGYLPRHAFLTLVKGVAVLAAHMADVLPRRWVRRMSMQPFFWDRP